MKATITDRKQKFITSHRKEKAGLHKCYAMLTPDSSTPGEAKAVAELRIYWPESNPFACLWTTTSRPSNVAESGARQGSGTASGGGYCKLSAAAGEAIRNAGVDLSEDIEGRGAVRAAMRAIADALGYPEAMLFETHP